MEETKRKKMSPVYDNLALIFLKGPDLLCLVDHVNAGFRISLVPERKISRTHEAKTTRKIKRHQKGLCLGL